MTLRNRLFLWISTLFLLAGLATFILEIVITDKEIKQTKEQLTKKVIEINENRRKQIEAFLASEISENQARVDVLLERLSSYPLQAAAFSPTEFNILHGTWLNASDTLQSNKWIDFIQNTNEGKLSSLIVPRNSAIDRSIIFEINDELAWILMGDLAEHPEPYLGVRLRFNASGASTHRTDSEVIETTGKVPRGFLLFSWRQLLFPDEASLKSPIFTGTIPPIHINLNAPWADGSKFDLESFFVNFDKARKYLLEQAGELKEEEKDKVKTWIQKQIEEGKNALPQKNDPLPQNKISAYIKKELSNLVIRYDQLYLIWCLAMINDLNIFGGDLFSPSAPVGIAVHFGKSPMGEGFHTKDVFLSTKVFDDAEYFKQNNHPDFSPSLSSSIAIFSPPNSPDLYLGNTVQYKVKENGEQKLGYLTIGVDGDQLLEKLVLATHEAAFLIHDNALVGWFSEEGKKMPVPENSPLPITEMLQNKAGTIMCGDIEYYYLVMTPFPNLDIHFVLLNLAAKEFALLNNLTQSAEAIIKGLLFNIHIIGFSVLILVILILHHLSRKITQPISQLAIATFEIARGHFEDAVIPKPSEKETDEVALLCRNFDHMVKDLREKEKVKAVLNKVVSQEIAHEILKGNIHLGGEEKKVTILFADIRNFTMMTQNMPPKEVIDLLNVCMTKISHLVDLHGGVIDKYVGDEAMALFGAPVACKESAYKAILCATQMVEALRKWNHERAIKQLPPVEMGIGIHTGNVLAGNMGAEDRLNYTVLGSNVNLAARLCNVAKPMEILISESVLEEPLIAEKVAYEKLPPRTLKGFDTPIVTYCVKNVTYVEEI